MCGDCLCGRLRWSIVNMLGEAIAKFWLTSEALAELQQTSEAYAEPWLTCKALAKPYTENTDVYW